MMSARTLGIHDGTAISKATAGQAIVAAALVLGLTGDLLLRAWPWGLNATLWLSGLAVATRVLPRFDALAMPRTRGAVWLWAAVGFSLMLLWRASPVLQTLNVIAIVLCLGMVAFRPTAGAIRRAGNAEYVANLAVSAIQMVLGMFVVLARHIDWHALIAPDRSPRLAAFARGLAIAAVPVLVFGALFASADVFFRDLLADIFVIDFNEFMSHVTLITVFGWLAGSYLWGALLAEREPLPEPPRASWLRFEFIEVGVVLGLVNALFLLFVSVQFRYMFGGESRVEASSTLTYAEYARRGFFELVTVAALVVPFLLITHWLLPRSNRAPHRFYGALAGVLIALVFVVMLSALQRMRLYQETFGLTELRVYTTAFMMWMFAALVWLALTVLRGQRDRFPFGALMAGLGVLIALNTLNPDALMVRRNASLAESARLFDSEYALGLSADAVPALVDNFDAVQLHERCAVATELRQRYDGVSYDWRTLNWGRINARDAVESSDAVTQAC